MFDSSPFGTFCHFQPLRVQKAFNFSLEKLALDMAIEPEEPIAPQSTLPSTTISDNGIQTDKEIQTRVCSFNNTTFPPKFLHIANFLYLSCMNMQKHRGEVNLSLLWTLCSQEYPPKFSSECDQFESRAPATLIQSTKF